jgi:nicotinamidase-related amidase
MENEIDASKLCIAVVDMQQNYLKHLIERERKKLIRTQISFLEEILPKDIPILVFEGQNPHDVKYEGTIPELREVINKSRRKYFSEKECDDGFTYYPLVDKKLQEWRIESVCFTGINAAACVQDSAEGAFGLGYRVLTAENLIGDRIGRGGIIHAKKWFQQNGTYYKRYKRLLKNLK